MRHALVCGASKGIGAATAVELAKQGRGLTLVARSAAEDTKTACIEAGAPFVHVLQCDFDDRDAAEATIAHHVAEHPVHILVNNAGGPPGGPLLAATDDDFTSAFGRHLFMAQRILRAVLPGMEAAGWGRIVNITSTSVREPIPNLGVSNTVRAAMASWAKTLSKELPPGITINTMLPGFTRTDRLASLAKANADRQGKSPADIEAAWKAMSPEGRLGEPQELGAAVAFLCSEQASFIRGIVLPVDGGRLASI